MASHVRHGDRPQTVNSPHLRTSKKEGRTCVGKNLVQVVHDPLSLSSHPAPYLDRLSLTCLRCLALLFAGMTSVQLSGGTTSSAKKRKAKDVITGLMLPSSLPLEKNRVVENVSREGLAPIVKAYSRLILVDGLVL